jgi:hypothetical protein
MAKFSSLDFVVLVATIFQRNSWPQQRKEGTMEEIDIHAPIVRFKDGVCVPLLFKGTVTSSWESPVNFSGHCEGREKLLSLKELVDANLQYKGWLDMSHLSDEFRLFWKEFQDSCIEQAIKMAG